MKRVAEGKKFRVFYDKLLGIWPYYILEDSTNATKSQGVDYNVKLTNYYFQTKDQMRLICNDMFEDGLGVGVWNPVETIQHKQI
tara:strand:+ start:68 stop:319 length:252 start_codon:yes stop_codon:yes gene_type:complete